MTALLAAALSVAQRLPAYVAVARLPRHGGFRRLPARVCGAFRLFHAVARRP